MDKLSFATRSLLSVFALTLATFTAQAQPSQTFVSAQAGNDGNPCTRTLPCRNLTAAHSLVASGGRVLILDSGDYAGLVITKSVSIEAAPGVAAVVKNAATATLISVNVGSTDKVFLQGLYLKSTSATNTRGLLYSTGSLVSVSNCIVEGFASEGIRAATSGQLTIAQTTVRNNSTGITFSPLANGLLTVTIEGGSVEKSSFNGIFASGADNATLKLTVRETSLIHNLGAGIRAIAGVNNSNLECVVEGIVSFGNGIGLNAERSGAVMRVSNATIVGNGQGLQISNLANIFTRGNNTLEGNTTNGSFSEVYVTK